MNVRRPGVRSGFSASSQRATMSRRAARPDFDADRILDAAQILDVRAVGIVGAQPGPGEVGSQIEEARPARHAAGLRRFVAQVQRLVRGEEVDAGRSPRRAPRARSP